VRQDQGKRPLEHFEEARMHRFLCPRGNALEPSDLTSYAARLDLDVTKFSSCVDSGTHSKDVRADIDTAERAGIRGSPAFLINGVLLSGAAPAKAFAHALREELASKKL
jgi:predicted DsbA family dithiol-disulfide isomerase